MNYNELERIFHSLKENQSKVSNTTYRERISKLKRLSKGLLKYKEEIREALYKDFKKHPSEVDLTEIYPVTTEIKHNIRNLRKCMKEKKVETPPALLGSVSYIKYEAKGVVLIMTPWNFPINLSLSPLENPNYFLSPYIYRSPSFRFSD